MLGDVEAAALEGDCNARKQTFCARALKLDCLSALAGLPVAQPWSARAVEQKGHGVPGCQRHFFPQTHFLTVPLYVFFFLGMPHP